MPKHAFSSDVTASDAALAAHLADTSDAHDASAISYAGGTGMSATDVEAALDELATEKANDSGTVHTTGNESIAGNKTFTDKTSFGDSGSTTTDVRVGVNGSVTSIAAGTYYAQNLEFDGTDWRYITTAAGALIVMGFGVVYCYNAVSGTAGNVATLVLRWGINANGNQVGQQQTVSGVAAAGSARTLVEHTTATVHRLVLDSASCALTFPSLGFGRRFTLSLLQDGTGGRVVTWPSTVRWAGGAAPTLTATANRRDVFEFTSDDNTFWYGVVVAQNIPVS